MEKKQQIIVGVVVVVAVAAIGGGTAVYMNAPKGGVIIFGTMYGPVDLDIIQSWDAASINVQRQVCEGLVSLDIRDPSSPIVPLLATSWTWDDDSKGITFTLRQGVKFHDGTDFNAEAAKWNFDRLAHNLELIQIESLWRLPNGDPIIAETIAVDEYTLKLELNDAYAPILGLLASWSGYMISPTAHADNWDTLIDTATGDLIGTGPFLYDSYEAEVEVLFSVNTDYWGSPVMIDDLIFSIITDSDARHAALQSGDVNLLNAVTPSMVSTFEADPNVQLVERPPSATIQYMELNNNLIPVEMRRAMCYAFDYDYLIDEIMEGFAMRMTSPIPEGVLYHAHEDFDLPSMDITVARQALIDAGWPGTEGLTANDDVSEGNEWASLVDDGTPIASYNYSYNIGNAVREDVLILISANFKQIGVEIIDAGMTFSEYLYRVYEVHGYHRNHINLAWSGWIPDYNDPSNYINMLMTNQAVAANGAQVDDAQLQAWMEEALTETDPVAREQIYYNIQKRCAEVIYPWIYGYVSTLPSATAPNVRGYYTNAFEDPLMRYMYIV